MVESAGPILLTGSSGQVGGELLRLLAPMGNVVAPDRNAMDMSDAGSVRDMIRSVRPRWIINPAAYTAVDKAESEPELAHTINAEVVGLIGEEARLAGAGVIHFSTDYVFDGTNTVAYVETDAPRPESVYGASKLAGEKALAASGAGHLIFRTSWVFGTRGKNFLLTILKLAQEREVLRVVGDQHGAPTWSQDLAEMTLHVMHCCEAAAKGHSVADELAEVGGVYHSAGRGETTWSEFAAEAVQLAKEGMPGERFARIETIATAEYPTAAKRPANSLLNCDKLTRQFDWTMMDWRESLRQVVAAL